MTNVQHSAQSNARRHSQVPQLEGILGVLESQVAIASQITLHGRLRDRQGIVAMLPPEVARRLESISCSRQGIETLPPIVQEYVVCHSPSVVQLPFGAAVSPARYSFDTWRRPLKEKTF